MAEGRSNAGIGQVLWVTKGTVEKHVRSILMKLQLPETAEVHRRVLAVVALLDAPVDGATPSAAMPADSACWQRWLSEVAVRDSG